MTNTPEPGEVYRSVRERLLELGAHLGPSEQATIVPASPAWSVKDTLGHLAGLATDVLAGRIEGAGSDPWTARQVAERSDRALDEVLGEWAEAGPALDEVLGALDAFSASRIVIDAWAHEVDVRSALGEPIPADTEAQAYTNASVQAILQRAAAGRPGDAGLRVVTDDSTWVAGEGEPATTLRISPFELSRCVLGRRSRAQMEGYDWGGADPSSWIAAMPIFSPPEHDLVDSAME